MCRSFTVTFTCTKAHPTHKRSFSQSCPKCKPKLESEEDDRPESGDKSPKGLSLSLSRSISRALEPKPDPAALRGYRLSANRACEVCDPDHRPLAQPPDLVGGRHTLSIEEGARECEALQNWVEGL